jgi:hypothetical protein
MTERRKARNGGRLCITNEQLEDIAKSMENIETHMATVADSLTQLLDYVKAMLLRGP